MRSMGRSSGGPHAPQRHVHMHARAHQAPLFTGVCGLCGGVCAVRERARARTCAGLVHICACAWLCVYAWMYGDVCVWVVLVDARVHCTHSPRAFASHFAQQQLRARSFEGLNSLPILQEEQQAAQKRMDGHGPTSRLPSFLNVAHPCTCTCTSPHAHVHEHGHPLLTDRGPLCGPVIECKFKPGLSALFSLSEPGG